LSRRLLILLVAAVAATGCGSQGSATTPSAGKRSDRLVDFSKKPPYVNSLDVDPRDGSLLLTTNRGFWRIDPKKDTVKRVQGTISAGGATSTSAPS